MEIIMHHFALEITLTISNGPRGSFKTMSFTFWAYKNPRQIRWVQAVLSQLYCAMPTKQPYSCESGYPGAVCNLYPASSACLMENTQWSKIRCEVLICKMHCLKQGVQAVRSSAKNIVALQVKRYRHVHYLISTTQLQLYVFWWCRAWEWAEWTLAMRECFSRDVAPILEIQNRRSIAWLVILHYMNTPQKFNRD